MTKLAAEFEEGQKKLNQKVYDYLKQNYPAECLTWVKDVKWKLSKNVPLDKVKMARRPGGPREMDKVKGIAGAIKEGKVMEPVVLVKLPNGDIKIADGYHRTLGYKHAEKASVASAYVAEVKVDKGPWDKEMHEKKLNIGKKAHLHYLELMEKKAKVEDEELMAGGAVAGGAYAINKAVPRIDGMERLYHGTDKDGKKGIQEKGLLASRAGTGVVTREADLARRIGEDQVAGKVYMTSKPLVALEVGGRQGQSLSNVGIVKAKIPYRDFQKGDLKTVKNPELRGMEKKEWAKTIHNETLFSPGEKQWELAYKQLDDPITKTIEGDVASKYIKGSRDFKGQNLAGLAEYAKHNPGRFASGLGLAGLGAAGIGWGVNQFRE